MKIKNLGFVLIVEGWTSFSEVALFISRSCFRLSCQGGINFAGFFCEFIFFTSTSAGSYKILRTSSSSGSCFREPTELLNSFTIFSWIAQFGPVPEWVLRSTFPAIFPEWTSHCSVSQLTEMDWVLIFGRPDKSRYTGGNFFNCMCFVNFFDRSSRTLFLMMAMQSLVLSIERAQCWLLAVTMEEVFCLNYFFLLGSCYLGFRHKKQCANVDFTRADSNIREVNFFFKKISLVNAVGHALEDGCFLLQPILQLLFGMWRQASDFTWQDLIAPSRA